MNNNSIIKKNLSQITAIVLGAAILTTVTQRSFDTIGTATDEAVGSLLNSKSSVEIDKNQKASN